MPLNNSEKLKIVMTEYEILRREGMERVKFQLQLYPLALAAISLLCGYVIVNEKYDALLLLPFITILLAYRWIWEVKLVDANRKYLLKIENEKIPELIGSFSEEAKKKDSSSEVKKGKDSDFRLVGWQNWYEDWRKEQPMDWLISAFLLLGVPTAISIIYCILNFNSVFHLLAAVIYTLLSLRILWIGIKTYCEREQKGLKDIERKFKLLITKLFQPL